MDTNAEISITPKEAMDIVVTFWTSMGTANTRATTYRYKFQSGDFYLIGEQSDSFNRMTGEGENVNINYLTGQKSITTGNMIENTGMKLK
ncbi:hypothetical protein HQ45_05055 [Porphyromonas crevioricanis]|uniref:Uncharacterized protein n=2 Tax=Porphyromonas crevioricanis TaxID=393921 RepID=A0A0A2FJD4_9PORP|nr:hypothetical protein [Porphyromonas crevioricanis]KGN90170.1 hypothetical protein HQ45_05055 [Porphyromonas crevioricanis]KGN94926.1 hypothetical protein HQ38_05225 [Porphyromonas crevioricanis]SJZ81949.1 hypothetical protein SAMN02745203_00963 [Porphyromonas crevioricanis]SQH72571.1 Uncharacterised protein [Porphyromonas crevioricanis]GAD04331.1 hypothetical protein PORCRE_13 [Porphyromonas crevioricanis JCM 15906]